MLVHGTSAVKSEGRIIFATLIGSFNEFGMKVLTDRLREEIENQNTQAFAILVDSTDLEGLTPEAYLILEKHNAWLNSQNMVAKALVHKSPMLSFINDHRIPSKAQQNFKEFDDKSLALKWLQSELSHCHTD